MRVAASSPAWLTRRAEERKSRCAGVRGLRLPWCVFGEEPCWALEEGADGGVFEVGGWLPSATSASRVGVVESSRLGWEKSAGARKSWRGICRAVTRVRCAERSALAGGDMLVNDNLRFVAGRVSSSRKVWVKSWTSSASECGLTTGAASACRDDPGQSSGTSRAAGQGHYCINAQQLKCRYTRELKIPKD